MLFGTGHQLGIVVRHGDICHPVRGLAACLFNLLGEGLQFVLPAGSQHHFRAFTGQKLGGGLSNA